MLVVHVHLDGVTSGIPLGVWDVDDEPGGAEAGSDGGEAEAREGDPEEGLEEHLKGVLVGTFACGAGCEMGWMQGGGSGQTHTGCS